MFFSVMKADCEAQKHFEQQCNDLGMVFARRRVSTFWTLACTARQGRGNRCRSIGGKEIRALRRLQRESTAGLYVFVSERGAPLSVAGCQRMVARVGVAARFPFLIHSHVATSSPTTAMTRGQFKAISVTGRSCPRNDTRP
jgi:hypothetical protein